jgi:hypothetical protein
MWFDLITYLNVVQCLKLNHIQVGHQLNNLFECGST